ncbi:unnamed protein product [Polarella glacialis]|uniref:Formyl transferase N-terminal domain-containing protein n=1 Tax=Polarella glacialis TaxID=89957 RepID=A0A813HZ33_POLGL|nr:unnamed protein product [Polarella glacialis]
MENDRGGRLRRVLVLGWGAAAEAVLQELSAYITEGGSSGSGSASAVCVVSHTDQAAEADLRDVCTRLGFECVLKDGSAEILEQARRFEPDLIISASYRKKIPASVLDLCPDAINFHPSLLPKHRGCWSGFWSLFEGDAEIGVTCHRMLEAFDAGRILHQERIPVAADDTSISVYRKLLPVTGACARSVLALYFGRGLPDGEEQPEGGSYHFRKLPFDGLIQPEWSDSQVERFIRAMHFPPFKGASILIGGQQVAVDSLEACLCPHASN